MSVPTPETWQQPGPYRITLAPCPPLDQLGPLWRKMAAHDQASFFTSWTWIGAWLQTLGDRCQPQLLTAHDPDNRLVGLALIGLRRKWRFGIVPVRTAYLHETGRADCDGITIEYNGLLVRGEDRAAVTAAVVRALVGGRLAGQGHDIGLDQLRLSGVEQALAPGLAGLQVDSVARRSYQVDLRAINAAGSDYLSTLKQRPRYLVRKSLKRLSASGPVSVHAAESLPQAHQFLAELMVLHTRYWAAKGDPGAFGTPFQRDFHARVLQAGFDRGEVVILAILHGGVAMGYLHYFCHAGTAHFYQSGIDYERYGAADSPGLAAHALAIEHFRNVGLAVYDFMAGDRQYKRTLATSSAELLWLTISRRNLKLRLITALRVAGRAIRQQIRALRGQVASMPGLAAAPANGAAGVAAVARSSAPQLTTTAETLPPADMGSGFGSELDNELGNETDNDADTRRSPRPTTMF